MGRLALLVPFPYATDDHQTANAQVLEKTGGARVVSEKDLTGDLLVAILMELPPTDRLRAASAERLLRVRADLLNAAQRVADLITEEKK